MLGKHNHQKIAITRIYVTMDLWHGSIESDMCVRVTVDVWMGVSTYIHVYMYLDISMPYVKKTRKEKSVHPSTHYQPGKPVGQPWVWTKRSHDLELVWG